MIIFIFTVLTICAIVLQFIINIPFALLILLFIYLVFFGYVFFNAKKIEQIQSDKKYNYAKTEKKLLKSVSKKLSGSVQIPTITGDIENIRRLKNYLKAQFPLVFLRAQEIDVGESLLLKISGDDDKKQPIILCAHLDVVEVNGDWTYAPFSGRIDEKYIWGRGSIDCKATLIAQLEAVENLLSSKAKITRDIYLAFGHDEEIGGEEGARKIVDYLEKEGVKPELVLDEGGHITKNFGGNPSFACACVDVAEKGILTLELSVDDAGGHSAYPTKNSPLARISEAVSRIEILPTQYKLIPLIEEYLKRTSPTFKDKMLLLYANKHIFKKAMLKELSKDKRKNALVSTTLVPTMAKGSEAFNVIPSHASMVFNSRVLPSVNPDDIIKLVEDTVKPLDVNVKVLFNCAPSNISDYKNALFLKLEENIKKRFGENVIVTPSLMPGATDSKFYERICPNVYRFSPLVLKDEIYQTVHGRDERVPIEALGAATEFYIAFIEDLIS